MKITLELELYQGRTWPSLEFEPEVVSLKEVAGSDRKTHTIILESDDGVILKNVGKGQYETVLEDGKIVQDQRVIVTNMWADDILLNKHLLKPYVTFFPVYHDSFYEYCKANGMEIKHEQNTYDIYVNGTWKFEFHPDFWPWYQQLRLARDMEGIGDNDVEKYIGVFDQESKNMLGELKRSINGRK